MALKQSFFTLLIFMSICVTEKSYGRAEATLCVEEAEKQHKTCRKQNSVKICKKEYLTAYTDCFFTTLPKTNCYENCSKMYDDCNVGSKRNYMRFTCNNGFNVCVAGCFNDFPKKKNQLCKSDCDNDFVRCFKLVHDSIGASVCAETVRRCMEIKTCYRKPQ